MTDYDKWLESPYYEFEKDAGPDENELILESLEDREVEILGPQMNAELCVVAVTVHSELGFIRAIGTGNTNEEAEEEAVRKIRNLTRY